MFIFLLNRPVGKFKYAKSIKIGTKLTKLWMFEQKGIAVVQYQEMVYLTSQNDVILFYFLRQDLLLIFIKSH